MSTDKILHRIQIQIDELAPTLELFVDDTIQPSVADCEKLQKQFTDLQENLAIYKYNKLNKEISPSFNIHARLSAAVEKKEELLENKNEIVKEIKETVKLEKEEQAEVLSAAPNISKPEDIKVELPKVEYKEPEVLLPKKEITEPVKNEAPVAESVKLKPAVSIGLNDKFRFMNDLFSQNSSEYNIALEQINTVNNWNEAEIYLNSLKNVYEWDEKAEVVKYFFSVVKKRFD